MEPYWNYVRLDQVKGRAIRICSHMDLPPEERHVDTYIYISRFSEEQKTERRVDQTLMNFDGGLTTDETIWNLMNSKKKMADSILDVMRAAAVDCELNTTENGGYACYRFDKATMEPLFHPYINVDIAESAAYVRGRR
jgi:di/tripeptidase